MGAARGIPVSREAVSTSKIPKAVEKVEGSFEKNPSWRFSIADTSHDKWSVLDAHEDVVYDTGDPTGTKIAHIFSKSIDSVLIEGLKARENTTWGALLTQNGGRKGGTNSHNIPMAELAKEAQTRAEELGIVTDEFLSLRLDGKKRVFGILEGGVLDIVWFDRNHEICPPNN
jgi:hypothetical protein